MCMFLVVDVLSLEVGELVCLFVVWKKMIDGLLECFSIDLLGVLVFWCGYWLGIVV